MNCPLVDMTNYNFYFIIFYTSNNPEAAKFPFLWLQQGRQSQEFSNLDSSSIPLGMFYFDQWAM